jgi:tetratricopeptide (TPR) repeat protein
MSKICLVIMAKHEAKTIKKAVECCRPFVDHVLISIDSESNDKTRDIANEIADTVNTHVFKSSDSPHGSFSKIRQSMIDSARELGYDWILQIDGHEYLNCKNGTTLKGIIEGSKDIDAFTFGLNMNNVIVRQIRLHKSDEHLKYNGDIHNNLSGVKKQLHNDDVEIIHDRTGQPQEHIEERNKQRTDMSEKILGEKVEKNPKDSRSMFYLAQSYKESGKTEEAIKMFYKYLEVSIFVAERWNARNYLFSCLMSLQRNDEAYKVIEDSLKEPQRAEAWIILGNKNYNEKKFEKALEFYTKASKIKSPTNFVFIDESAYSWAPYDHMGMCHNHLKNYLSAIECDAIAIRLDPPEKDIKRMSNNITFWISNLRKDKNIVSVPSKKEL